MRAITFTFTQVPKKVTRLNFAYDVAIVLILICINSPVHRIKFNKLSERFGTTTCHTNGTDNLKINFFCKVVMRLGDGCHNVTVGRTPGQTVFFSVRVCLFSVDFVMHVFTVKTT